MSCILCFVAAKVPRVFLFPNGFGGASFISLLNGVKLNEGKLNGEKFYFLTPSLMLNPVGVLFFAGVEHVLNEIVNFGFNFRRLTSVQG